MSDTLQTILLGIIEGLTEFLPVSSTGHLLIAEHWLGPRSELFNVAIQAGAMLAVVLIFWRGCWHCCCAWIGRHNRDYLAEAGAGLRRHLVGGLIAKQFGLELPETVLPVALALIVGGILILLIEWRVRALAPAASVTWKVAFWVGAARCSPPCFRAPRARRQRSSPRCWPA